MNNKKNLDDADQAELVSSSPSNSQMIFINKHPSHKKASTITRVHLFHFERQRANESSNQKIVEDVIKIGKPISSTFSNNEHVSVQLLLYKKSNSTNDKRYA